MQAAATVGVLIPTYNPGAYLQQAIDSVRRQTFSDYHIYVVDDGSSTVPDLADADDITVVRRANAGVSRTRNFAASLGDEQYLAFLDQDDVWHPQKLARQVELMADRPEASGCFTWARNIDDTGQVMGNAYGAYDHDISRGRALGGGVVLSSLLVRRSAFTEAGGFDPAQLIVQDWDLLIRVSLIGDVLVCRDRLTDYRTHDGNTSRNVRRLALESKALLTKAEALLSPHERTDVNAARRDFARLAAGTAKSQARRAAKRGQLREALGSAVWGAGQSCRAAVFAGRVRMARRS